MPWVGRSAQSSAQNYHGQSKVTAQNGASLRGPRDGLHGTGPHGPGRETRVSGAWSLAQELGHKRRQMAVVYCTLAENAHGIPGVRATPQDPRRGSHCAGKTRVHAALGASHAAVDAAWCAVRLYSKAHSACCLHTACVEHQLGLKENTTAHHHADAPPCLRHCLEAMMATLGPDNVLTAAASNDMGVVCSARPPGERATGTPPERLTPPSPAP